MSEDNTETSTVAPEVIAAAGATGSAPEAPTNIIPLPVLASSDAEQAPQPASDASETPAASPTAKPEPKNIQELIASIDIESVTEHEIIVDLIAGIQQLAVRGTIALGLLERMAVAKDATEAAETTETPAA